MNREILKIDDKKLYNISLDGVGCDEIKLEINCTIRSNKDLSDVINSLRLLRGFDKYKKKNEDKDM